MSLARWIGARAADVVAFFRDKPFIPCQIDWYAHNVDALTADGVPPWAPPPLASAGPFDRNEPEKDDCCPDYEVDCCIATDTIAEWREWNARK